jgi:hypothetical protein
MQSPLNVYPTELLHAAAQTLASNDSETAERIDLSEPRPSKVLLIDNVFPSSHKGDVFIVYGNFTAPKRRVIHMSRDEFSKSPLNIIQSEIARIYEKHGYADLEIFIVPEGGLTPPPYKEGTHFSICTDTDYYYSLLTPEQRKAIASPRKQREAEKLLDVLETLETSRPDRQFAYA